MIRAENLKKIYRTETVETTAVDDVSLEIGSAEFVGLMGPSGSGKSTLLHLLGLIDTPTSGRLFFAEHDVSRSPERKLAAVRKANVGFIFQSFNLIDELTVFENVELPLKYLGRGRTERRQRVEEVLARLEMGHRRTHRPQQLSGGQQQRVAIARAIVARPRLLLADEPTGNLDSANGDEVMAILERLCGEGTSIVMATHSDRCAASCQRVLRLRDGRLADGD